MAGDSRLRKLLWILVISFLSAFVLTMTSICTSSWYTTHPLAPLVHTSFGTLGLIEHCDERKKTCAEREGILQFADESWPYRPLVSRGE